MHTNSTPLIAAFIFSCCLLSNKVFGSEFYVWIDEVGSKHVSSIPRAGFSQRGDLRRAYNPNSLTSQHHAMRNALSVQAAEIARQEAERKLQENQPIITEARTKVRVPKEGIMGLRDLIKLERRGGKYAEQ